MWSVERSKKTRSERAIRSFHLTKRCMTRHLQNFLACSFYYISLNRVWGVNVAARKKNDDDDFVIVVAQTEEGNCIISLLRKRTRKVLFERKSFWHREIRTSRSNKASFSSILVHNFSTFVASPACIHSTLSQIQ